MKPKEIKTTAFNEGCDARLAGKPATTCPYESPELAQQWRHGWANVDGTWGRDAKWPINPLPPVK
jgi:ribosome modulation factor